MKDSMHHLFRDRFQGHEAPVDPAIWQVIEARLIAAGPVADPVNELFRERFEGHESHVGPKVWDSISSQLGHPVASAGFGWMAAGVAGVVAVGAMVFALQSEPENRPDLAQTAPVAVEEVRDEANESASISDAVVEIPAVIPDENRVSQEQRLSVATRGPVPSETEPTMNETTVPSMVDATHPQIEEHPEVVEQIIQTITEQVKQEVEEETRHMPLAEPGSGVYIVHEPISEPIKEEESTKLLLPNTFTPNNDGINDRYEVSMVGFSSLMMRVYSIKTNQLVFATDSGEPWVGSNCEDGMYLVAVEAMTLEGRMVAEGKVVYLNRSSTN